MNATFSHVDGAVVCHLAGDLDAFTASSFRRTTAVLAEQPAPVVIDLTGIGFIDSSGLSALLGAVRRCHERGLPVLCCARRPLSTALHTVGFDRIAPMTASLDEAVACLETAAAAAS